MSSAPKLQGLKIGCYPKGYAAPSDVPCQCNMRRSPSKLKRTLPQSKIYVTSKSPVGDISVVTLIRTDTTLDHSQKAEKVCLHVSAVLGPSTPRGKEVSWLPHARKVGWRCGLLSGRGRAGTWRSPKRTGRERKAASSITLFPLVQMKRTRACRAPWAPELTESKSERSRHGHLS